MPSRDLRRVNFVAVHCSASDASEHDNADTIRHWHVKERGWDDIGYHFVITKNGQISMGRPIGKPGAHIRGHNENSIGICLTGNRSFSEAQIDTLIDFCRCLRDVFDLDAKDFLGHCEIDKTKTCPNIDMQQVRAALVA